jgi:hypothetical protein
MSHILMHQEMMFKNLKNFLIKHSYIDKLENKLSVPFANNYLVKHLIKLLDKLPLIVHKEVFYSCEFVINIK